jgi:hypothetical protein
MHRPPRIVPAAAAAMAITACGSSDGSLRPPNAGDSSSAVTYADCMRTNGVPNFPDPGNSPPANPAGFAMAFGHPGAYIVIPDALNPQSPAFRRAAQACRLPGTSGGPKRE